MSGNVHLALIFHDHQPVGNFDFVFRDAFQKAYRPMVGLLEQHANVRVSLHISGPLRDWLLANEREFYLDRLGALVRRGQVEMIGGAYYEPILIMLDDADKIGQMQMMSDALNNDFGTNPGGMWLAERVWEPALAKPIVQAGLKYALVDDTHFHYGGFNDADLYGYYVTEEQSHALNLLPISRKMRYMTPYHSVDDLIAALREVHDDPNVPPNPLIVNADDGEKFGLWPGTYHLCWGDGQWMETFFNRLQAESDWLTTTTPAAYIQAHHALGRAYLPTASYLEMSTWALPAAAAAELPVANDELTRTIQTADAVEPHAAEKLRTAQRYLRGGLWRNFMVKYPEVNHMQKRGVYVGRRVHALPDGDAKTTALSHLWAAQCNCAYWHGLFGGIYLFHIRAANYANLIAAHAATLTDSVQIEMVDFDMDSRDELAVNASPFSLVFDLPRGGALIEWDDLPSQYNLLNIMTRHQEGYHLQFAQAIPQNLVITPNDPDWEVPGIEHIRAKEPGLENHLIVDQHRRGTLIDHFFDADLTVQDYMHANYTERGDFVGGAYAAAVNGAETTQATITLTREGQVFHREAWHPLRIEKQLTVTHGERVLPVQYTLTNTGDGVLDLHFGIETAFGFDGGDSHYCYFECTDADGDKVSIHLGHTGTFTNLNAYRLGTHIRHFEVLAESDQPTELWLFPLAPVTMSESGYERVHQGVICLNRYRVALQPGAAWSLDLRFTVLGLA